MDDADGGRPRGLRAGDAAGSTGRARTTSSSTRARVRLRRATVGSGPQDRALSRPARQPRAGRRRAPGAGDVLDVFAYTGGFACHALRGRRATGACCVESSPEALAGARRNLELNGLAERAEMRAGQRLRRAAPAGSRARALRPGRARSAAVRARPHRARGRRCAATRRSTCARLRLLEPGGRLATFSCSHHVTRRSSRRPARGRRRCRRARCASSPASPRPPTTRCCSPSPRRAT